MKKKLLGEWIRLGWHVDGMPWESYLNLSWWDRWAVHSELSDLIDKTDSEDGEGAGPRPKHWRK